jgi:hypothetical protein
MRSTCRLSGSSLVRASNALFATGASVIKRGDESINFINDVLFRRQRSDCHGQIF